MDTFIQLTVTGLSSGAILALAALGFVLIYKASEVINFAQGQFLLIGAYVVWALNVDAGLHWALAVAGAIGVAIVLGLVVERLILRPLVGEPTISVIMVTIGLAQVLGALVQIIWGTHPHAFPGFIPDDTITIAGAGVGAVVGGMLVANLIGVSGEVSNVGLLVFPVVIVGGLDSVPGAVVGGAIIGLLTAYTGGYIGEGLDQVIPYIALVAILLVKPYGL